MGQKKNDRTDRNFYSKNNNYNRNGKRFHGDKNSKFTTDETENQPLNNGSVPGRNAVRELLKSGRSIEKIFIQKGDREGSLTVLSAEALSRGIPLIEVEKAKLDALCGYEQHQGVVAIAGEKEYVEIEDLLKIAEERNEKPLIVIADGVSDPHNLGAIIRCAEGAGAHGIIIPKRRNVGVTPTVYKCSAGAIEHMRIAKVTNINAIIDQLKEEGIWIYGADIDGKDFSYNTNFSGPCALVIGSEGRGISKLTLKKCDVLVKIPMIGKINSLNASVAGGIMMYEVLKGRLTK